MTVIGNVRTMCVHSNYLMIVAYKSKLHTVGELSPRQFFPTIPVSSRKTASGHPITRPQCMWLQKQRIFHIFNSSFPSVGTPGFREDEDTGSVHDFTTRKAGIPWVDRES